MSSNDSAIPLEIQFPEKKCPRCGEVKSRDGFSKKSAHRDGLESHCKACVAAYARNRYATRPEVREKQKQSNERQKANGYFTEYSRRPEVKERTSEYRKRRYRNDLEYREKVKHGNRDYHRRYIQTERGKELTNFRNRMYVAKRRAAQGSFTKEDIALMLKNQKGKCWYCQCKLDKYHIEHRVPVSRGGSSDPSNLVLSCAHCNLSKHDKLPHEWNGRLL